MSDTKYIKADSITRNELKRILKGKGNLTKLVYLTRLTPNTIKRVRDGLTVVPGTIDKIKESLMDWPTKIQQS